jgi:hypothetical protein
MKYLKKFEQIGPPKENLEPTDPSINRTEKNNAKSTKEFADSLAELPIGKITNKLRRCVESGNLSEFIHLLTVQIPEFVESNKSGRSLSPERFPLEYVIMKGKLQLLNYLVGNLKVKLIRIDNDFLSGSSKFTRQQMIDTWVNRPEPLLKIAIDNNQKDTFKYLLSHGLTNRLTELIYYINKNDDISDKKYWIDTIESFRS